MNQLEMNNNKDSLTRIDTRLKEEIISIKEERERLGLPKLSDRMITSLIVRHTSWKTLKEDIICYEIPIE